MQSQGRICLNRITTKSNISRFGGEPVIRFMGQWVPVVLMFKGVLNRMLSAVNQQRSYIPLGLEMRKSQSCPSSLPPAVCLVLKPYRGFLRKKEKGNQAA